MLTISSLSNLILVTSALLHPASGLRDVVDLSGVPETGEEPLL